MLNPEATPFYPSSMYASVSLDDYVDEGISQEELDELEQVDEWVQLMLDLDEMERQHLIQLAIEAAPAAAHFIEEQVAGRAARGSSSKGSHSKSWKKGAHAQHKQKSSAPAAAPAATPSSANA